MYRIVIFSDTHGHTEKCIKILDNLPCDLIIHLGDLVRDAEEIQSIFPHIPIKYVAGNNDFGGYAPYELIVEVEGIKMLLCHGHGISEISLAKRAEQMGCTFALRGHTHISGISEINSVTILNPGSISRPRDGGYGSYGVIEIENGIPKGCIIPV